MNSCDFISIFFRSEPRGQGRRPSTSGVARRPLRRQVLSLVQRAAGSLHPRSGPRTRRRQGGSLRRPADALGHRAEVSQGRKGRVARVHHQQRQDRGREEEPRLQALSGARPALRHHLWRWVWESLGLNNPIGTWFYFLSRILRVENVRRQVQTALPGTFRFIWEPSSRPQLIFKVPDRFFPPKAHPVTKTWSGDWGRSRARTFGTVKRNGRGPACSSWQDSFPSGTESPTRKNANPFTAILLLPGNVSLK